MSEIVILVVCAAVPPVAAPPVGDVVAGAPAGVPAEHAARTVPPTVASEAANRVRRDKGFRIVGVLPVLKRDR